MNISQIKVGNTTYDISDSVARTALESGERIHVLTSCTGTTDSSNNTTWTGTITDTNVSTLYTGLIVAYKITTVGGSNNTFFEILKNGSRIYMGYDDSMDLPYYDENPVLLGSSITDVSKFPIGSIIILMFDENATVDTQIGNVSTTLQGCWKIINYKLGESLHYVLNITGIVAKTTTPYNAALWIGTCPGVTALYTGLTVQVKVPVAGNGTYGTVLNINELGNHPVVANVNTMVSTRYAVGCIITLIYDAEQAANVYQNSASASSITGCWKIADYDSVNIYQLRSNGGPYVAYAAVKRNVLFLQKNETSLLPVNSVGGTGTNKTLTTESFNPFGCILYYNSTTEVAAGANISYSYLYWQVTMDLRYSFNTGTTLTTNKDIYLVADLQSDGMAKLASNPIAQELPSTEDGKLYIYLGHAYNTYCIELHPVHPIYWYKDRKILLYTGIDPNNIITDKNFVGGPLGSVSGWQGYYKIYINNEQRDTDICFNVQLYTSYKIYQFVVSGFISSGTWLSNYALAYAGPVLAENMDVIFGHDTVSELNFPWVAVRTKRYCGITVNTVSCGRHTSSALYEHNPSKLFNILYVAEGDTLESTLGGTIIKTRIVSANCVTTILASENSNTSGSLTFDGRQKLYDITLSGDVTGISLIREPSIGELCKIILNAGDSDKNVLISYNSSSRVTTTGQNLAFQIASGGYVEVVFYATSLRTYVRVI